MKVFPLSLVKSDIFVSSESVSRWWYIVVLLWNLRKNCRGREILCRNTFWHMIGCTSLRLRIVNVFIKLFKYCWKLNFKVLKTNFIQTTKEKKIIIFSCFYNNERTFVLLMKWLLLSWKQVIPSWWECSALVPRTDQRTEKKEYLAGRLETLVSVQSWLSAPRLAGHRPGLEGEEKSLVTGGGV